MVTDKQKQFIEKSSIVHGTKFDYQNAIYKNIDTKVEIRCIEHNIVFYQSPYNHMNGRLGCVECINQSKRNRYAFTLDQFIEEARKVHGNLYDYSKSIYKNNNTKICVICPKHGDFYVTPANHIHNKHKCYHCSVMIRGSKRRKSQEQFISDVHHIHKGYYTYDNTVYNGTLSIITVTCPKHGNFNCSASDHLYSKSGCPKCGSSKSEEKIRQILSSKNIEFLEQHRFTDCRNKLPLPFDFYLPEYNTCIEYDGEGHYTPIKRSQTKDHGFEKIKINDNIKTNYCTKNGIRLIRIPFWEANNLEESIMSQLKNQ